MLENSLDAVDQAIENSNRSDAEKVGLYKEAARLILNNWEANGVVTKYNASRLRNFGQEGFKTEKSAARAALISVNERSKKEGVEYGGLIYKNGELYYYSPAVAGDASSVDPFMSEIPNGVSVSAYYHTHGADIASHANENFSNIQIKVLSVNLDINISANGTMTSAISGGRQINTGSIGDIPFAKHYQINGYLGAPRDAFKHYNLSEDKIYDYGTL